MSKTCHNVTANISVGVVQSAGMIAESTEAVKKVCQITKSAIELVGSFTNVGSLNPLVSSLKVVILIIGGTDILGRIKEWFVRDKNGETLFHKFWTKIVSRICLAFAHVIDFIRMLDFFKFFKFIKLGRIVRFLGKVAFFRVLIEGFKAIDVLGALKNMFILFSAQWAILDGSINLNRGKKNLQHAQLKQRNWTKLRQRSMGRQAAYFAAKANKYTKAGESYVKMSKEEREKAIKKLTRSEQKTIKNAIAKAPQYKKLADRLGDTNVRIKDSSYDRLDKFLENKAKKWDQKIKVIKVGITKNIVSVVCEIAKMATVFFALLLILSGIGTILGVAIIMTLLGLTSNSLGLFKFIFDRLYTGPSVDKVAVPRIRAVAAAAAA